MSCVNITRLTTPVALSFILASCGSGTTVLPDIGAAGSEENGENIDNSGSGDSVSGTVADGYIVGATVCVDVNSNESCDADEPSAVTTAGGAYNLVIPTGSEDKNIVAYIPATAIDEDNPGVAIGEELVFIAPAGKPEFVSPLTTLVHQEIKANPTLDVADAETILKDVLGIEDDTISLFDDYVAGQVVGNSGTETESNEQFRNLHNAARVVTSVIKDVENRVTDAATADSSVDVAGSASTRLAIREIVMTEVKELLPEISEQVATLSENAQEGEEAVAFNPDDLALALIPANITENVADRINAVEARPVSTSTDFEAVLADGLYWMDFDCEYQDYTNPMPGESDTLEDSIYPSDCAARYGSTQLDSTGSALDAYEYKFDSLTAAWADIPEDTNDHRDFVLFNGQWNQEVDGGPEGSVTFNADGSATIQRPTGRMEIEAVTQQLGSTSVLSHFFDTNADNYWFDFVDSDDLFVAGSEAYITSVKEFSSPYVMFNYPSYPADSDQCVQFSGNCNVVGQAIDGQFSASTSLATIQEGSVQGMEIVTHAGNFGHHGSLKFMSAASTSTNQPTSGTVVWQLPDNAGIEPAPGSECHVDGTQSSENNEGTVPSDDNTEQGSDQSPDGSDCGAINESDQQAQDALETVATGPSTNNIVESQWRVIVVDGVELLEIDVPAPFRIDGDFDHSQRALFLAEFEGVVRLGMVTSGVRFDRVSAYNESAITSLKAIIEDALPAEEN